NYHFGVTVTSQQIGAATSAGLSLISSANQGGTDALSGLVSSASQSNVAQPAGMLPIVAMSIDQRLGVSLGNSAEWISTFQQGNFRSSRDSNFRMVDAAFASSSTNAKAEGKLRLLLQAFEHDIESLLGAFEDETLTAIARIPVRLDY